MANIQVTDFEDYDYLHRYGETYFEPIEGARFKQSNAQVIEGYLEMSNVSVVQEMVNMITTTRQYESNQKIVQTMDSSMEIAVQQLGQI